MAVGNVLDWLSQSVAVMEVVVVVVVVAIVAATTNSKQMRRARTGTDQEIPAIVAFIFPFP